MISMLWITRPRCHVDRTACAWLVRRFIDPDATFGFAPDREAARTIGGTPFDMRGVELGHHEGRCSFESFLVKYNLSDRALEEIAAVGDEAGGGAVRIRTPQRPGRERHH